MVAVIIAIIGDERDRTVGQVRVLRAVVVGNRAQDLLVVGDRIRTGQAQDTGAAVVRSGDTRR